MRQQSTLTGIGDHVSCHDPAHLTEATQVVRDCNQRGAYDGDLDVDQQHAQGQASVRS